MNHALPPLPYDVAALEPHIDTRTLQLHHGVHHAAYVRGLCSALEAAPPELRTRSAGWLLRNLDQVPEDCRVAVRNHGGGHVNHSLLWRAMSPGGGGAPVGALADAIDQAFGSARKFRRRFEEAGRTLFGSGWVWLVRSAGSAGDLQILTTSGHDNPMTQGCFPILLNDVWEHAYYLKHESRRPDYLERWWSVVNWPEAGRRLARASSLPAPVRRRTDAAAPGGQPAVAASP